MEAEHICRREEHVGTPDKHQDADRMSRSETPGLKMGSGARPASGAARYTAGPGGWLGWLCLSRFALSLIFTAYAGVMPLVQEAWGMSAAKAATVQSAWHLGYLVSLFVVGMIADRYGPRRTYLATSVLAAGSAGIFAWFSHGYVS